MSENESTSSAVKTAPSGWWGQQAARLTTLVRSGSKWCLSGPVSLFLALALLVLFIVSSSIDRAAMEPHVAAGLGHGWWTIFTAVAWIKNPLQLVADIILLLTFGVWLERRITSVRYALVGGLAYWAGAALTVGAVYLIGMVDHEWGELLGQQAFYGPLAFLIGIALAASVRMDTLWRRRVRVMVGTILLVMLAFAGSLGTLFTVIVAAVGLFLGYVVWGKSRDRQPAIGGSPDGRTLVALAVAGVVLGTLISLRSADMIGALSALRYSVTNNPVSAEMVQQMCSLQGLESQCAHYTYLLQTGGIGAQILSLMPLLVQLVLAWGLWGGRRAAFWGTIALQGTTALVAVMHLLVVWSQVASWTEGAGALGFNEFGHPTARFIVPIVVPIVLLAIVCATRRFFTVRAAPGTYSRFWRAMGLTTLAALLLTLIIGVSIGAGRSFFSSIWLLSSDFVVRLLPSSVLSLVTPQMLQESRGAMVLLEWMPIIPWAASVFFLLRSFKQRYLPGSIPRAEYIELVRQTQAGSMGWITTWEGNRYWGSKHRKAGVAYRADGGVALTVGDVAAKEADLPEVLQEFVEFCTEQGLTPAFYSVHAPVVAITDQWGWARLQVAEETLLTLADLEFKGKKFQDIRTALNRATKEGITTEWTSYAECRPALMDQIKQISAEWVSDKGLPEMGFTLGGVAELDDPDVRILVAIDGEGTVHGVTSWMPIYEEGEVAGWTLDFMRRREGGFRPVMEYLIASAALWAKEEGYETLSLSGAPLARAQGAESDEEGSSAAILDQILDTLGGTLEPVYGFRSLLAFKAKFKPEYAPVYLVLPSVAELPTVGLAIGRAYLPELGLGDTVRLGQSLRQK